jgi:hypothetical protein
MSSLQSPADSLHDCPLAVEALRRNPPDLQAARAQSDRLEQVLMDRSTVDLEASMTASMNGDRAPLMAQEQSQDEKEALGGGNPLSPEAARGSETDESRQRRRHRSAIKKLRHITKNYVRLITVWRLTACPIGDARSVVLTVRRVRRATLSVPRRS